MTAKQTFDLNKWYRSTYADSLLLFFVKTSTFAGATGFGFDKNGKWKSNMKITPGKDGYFRVADEEEINLRMTKEAERRGFVKGNSFYSQFSDNSKIREIEPFT